MSSGSRGIFPCSYVHIEKKSKKPQQDRVLNELLDTLREWAQLLLSYHSERKMKEFQIIKDKLSTLQEGYYNRLFYIFNHINHLS